MTIRGDGITDSVASSEWDDEGRYGGRAAGDEKPKRPKHKYDYAPYRTLLRKLQDWYEQEWQRQAHNRYQMALDEDYYDSLQWSEEDASVLLERGQAPVVYNELKPTIDWLIGTERRTKIDYKVLPRRKEMADDAEVKTKLLKYLSDTNKEPMARSRAFSDAARCGVGWLEIGVRGDVTDEPIYYRYQSWRQMLYDSNGGEWDLSDARYLFRWKYVDQDVAESYFPDRRQIIGKSAEDANKMAIDEDDDIWYMGTRVTEPGYDYSSAAVGKYKPYDASAYGWTKRERVKLVECWYREPVRVQRIQGGSFDGERFTGALEQQSDVNAGVASVYDKTEMELRCCIYVDGGILWEGPSPYEHNKFPFVPIWCHRRSRDNAPYGVIRGLRDAQDGMNKRMSKALWILSANQIQMEEGAVDDVEELRDEAARPDGVIIRRRGKELVVGRDNALADQHVKLMQLDQAMIRSVSGVTSENLGRETNADSGKAIIARQEQGSLVTTELFDNLRYSVQLAGEIQLSLIEQWYSEARTVRLVGERGTTDFVDINTPQDGGMLNDVTAAHADFHVSQQDYRDSLRQSMFESLFDIVSRLAQMSPEIAFKMLDLVVELADVPNRDELVARIRELNGMRDPDSDPTPEEQQREAQERALKQMQQQLMLEKAKAEVEELKHKATDLSAQAVNERLDAMQKALEAAQVIVQAPPLGAVADDLLQSAGNVDRTAQSQIDTAMTEQAAAAQAAQMQQAEQMQRMQQLAQAEQAAAQTQSDPRQQTPAGMPPMPGAGGE